MAGREEMELTVMWLKQQEMKIIGWRELGRRKGTEVVDNLEGEMSRRRRGGGYVLGIGAGNKLVCCTQRR